MEKKDKFKERETFAGKKYNSPIYGTKKEEFEFYESLYELERKSFQKGFLIAIVVIVLLILIVTIM